METDTKNRSSWPFSKPLEFLQKVKYGGAVGKQTVIAVVALIVLAVAMICVWGNVIAIYVIVGAVVLVFGVSLFSIDRTLQKHPQLALLDGTELVAYRKVEMEMAAKKIASSSLSLSPDDQLPSADPELPQLPVSEAEIQEPDK